MNHIFEKHDGGQTSNSLLCDIFSVFDLDMKLRVIRSSVRTEGRRVNPKAVESLLT